MASPSSDRNLLFGILAVQMDFVSRDQLLAGMNAWVLDKQKTLGQVLQAQKALSPERDALLDALVREHLKQHNDDPAQSLAAVSSANAVRQDLLSIDDQDVHQSLAHVVKAAEGEGEADGNATVGHASVGQPTSAGTRFRILRPHAKGGLGEVHVAHDEELHREVALKQIQDRHADDPDSRARFQREAEITGGLEHPGIVPVYGLGYYAGGRPFYAMRFIRGDSLKHAVDRFFKSHTFPLRDAPSSAGSAADGRPAHLPAALYFGVQFRKLLTRFLDVCNALQYAHDRGVLHRDLKPGNIMLGPYGETLVVDWGLAKAGMKEDGLLAKPAEQTLPAASERALRLHNGDSSSETVAGCVIGTPAFMSPEQALGRLDLLGPRSDVYGLGATLYFVLTGQAPFKTEGDLGQLLAKVQRGELVAPCQKQPALPAALQAICLKAMATRPADRYASPRELADDLEHWLADEPIGAWPEPWTVKTRRWVGKHRTLVASAAAALLVALIGLAGGALYYQNQQAEAARRLALTEQAVRQAVARAEKIRAELHASLKQQGGVQTLLNQPAHWLAQITTAKTELERAKGLAANAEADLDADLATQMQQLADDLDSDAADYRLALRLEKIRQDTAVVLEGKLDYLQAEREYPLAFAEAGLAIELGREAVAAGRIVRSPIQEQLVASLDYWASIAERAKQSELPARLLTMARLADPDPWRDQVRDPATRKKRQAMEELAETALKDPKLMGKLSPHMLQVIGLLLSNDSDKKEAWLREAQRLHPADYWINFDLAARLHQSESTRAEAVGFYRAALAIRPGSTAAWNNLGIALSSQKKSPEAVNAYKKALDIDPKLAVAWNNLGNALRDQKNLPGALDAYKKALESDPKFAVAWNNLGSALRDQKNLPGAVDAYKKALDIDPKYAAAWNNLGIALSSQKKSPEAVNAYKKALDIDPKYAAAWNNLGNALRDQKKLLEALDAYRKALDIAPKYAAAWNNLGMAQSDQKNLPEAVDAYKKALDINPKYAAAWDSLGSALYYQKKLPEAVEAYKKALDLDPKYTIAWYNLGVTLRDQKNLPEAVDAYKKALDIDPKYAAAWNNLGRALRDQKKLPEAVDAFNKALDIDPKDAIAWNNLGLTLRDHKKPSEAVDAFNKALDFNPNSTVTWYNLGNAQRDQKNLPEAVDAYKKALENDPKYSIAWYNLGVTLRDQKNLPEAVDAYKKALDIDPKYAAAWNNLGRALRDQKKLPEAVDAFNKALDIDPKDAIAWNNLGLTLRDHKKPSEAVDAFNKALDFNPNSTVTWYNLGNAQRDQKNLPEAVDAYKKALENDPKYTLAWRNLGHALRDQKNLPEAVDAYKKALNIDPKHALTWLNLGNALRGQKNLPEAVDAYKKAVDVNPKYTLAWLNLGNTLRDQKNLAEAVEAYKKAIELNGNDAEAHCNLGQALRDMAEFAQALEALQKGHELGSRQPGWSRPSAAWVKECERLVELDKMLPGVLQGEAATASDYLALADMCRRYKKAYRDAAALSEKAFAAESQLAEDLGKFRRYNAACVAALAAAGKGAGADKLDDSEKTHWRQQALAWLKADLAAFAKFLEQGPLSAVKIKRDLQHWQKDSDLAGVRKAQELAQLPAKEAAAWRTLWADVDALLKKTEPK